MKFYYFTIPLGIILFVFLVSKYYSAKAKRDALIERKKELDHLLGFDEHEEAISN